MVSRVTIKGLAGLQADLGAVSDDLVNGLVKAREAVAEALASDIATDAPVDTGKLQSTVDAEGTEVIIGGDLAPYAGDVEDRDPFIRPNIDSMVKTGVDIAADVIRKEIG